MAVALHQLRIDDLKRRRIADRIALKARILNPANSVAVDRHRLLDRTLQVAESIGVTSLPEDSGAAILAMPEDLQVLGAMKCFVSVLLPTVWESLPPKLRIFYDYLLRCPPDLSLLLLKLEGVSQYPWQCRPPLQGIRDVVVELLSHPEAPALLREWDHTKVDPRAQVMSLASGRLINLMNRQGERYSELMKQSNPARKVQLLAEAEEVLNGLDFLEQSIQSACDVASGRVLHQNDQLVLHHRGVSESKPSDLVLSVRCSDGLLAYHPRYVDRRVGHQAIRDMRAWVRSYRGRPYVGEITPSPACTRLCRLIGLVVKGGFGHLESRRPKPKGFG